VFSLLDRKCLCAAALESRQFNCELVEIHLAKPFHVSFQGMTNKMQNRSLAASIPTNQNVDVWSQRYFEVAPTPEPFDLDGLNTVLFHLDGSVETSAAGADIRKSWFVVLLRPKIPICFFVFCSAVVNRYGSVIDVKLASQPSSTSAVYHVPICNHSGHR